MEEVEGGKIVKNTKDDSIIIRFTDKGKELGRQINMAFDEWLKASNMTKDDLLKYKEVRGFHIVDDDVGFYLAYYEKGIEKQIGMGLYKEQLDEAQWIFGYICAILDGGNNYKSTFSKEYLKWGAKYE